MARSEITPLPYNEETVLEISDGIVLKELSLLRKINIVITPTLLTFDVPVPADKITLQKLGLASDGWRLVSSIDGWQHQELRGVEAFLAGFRRVLERDLYSFIQEQEGLLRLGGSVFTTLRVLLELQPEIKKGICFVPVGKADEMGNEVGELMRRVNQKRQELMARLGTQLNNRLLIEETLCSGLTPICISFYEPGGRSMVMIRDEQEINIPDQAITGLQGPNLLLVDTRELIQPSYMGAALQLAARPNVFTVIGLGAGSILPEAVNEIKTLQRKTQGEMAFSGNKGEIEVLLGGWDGASEPRELVRKANLRFILETKGQKGAVLYLRLGNTVYVAEHRLAQEEIFNGDTTNAGDAFLAVVLAGLMKLPCQEEGIETQLLKVLQEASRKTLGFLRARA